MTTTRKLKTWTIISHGLIVIGAGHGIFCLFIIEIWAFPYLTKENFSFSFSSVDNHLPVIGLTTFLGQIALIFSLAHNKEKLRNISHIIGLCMLWLSIIYFTYDAGRDSYMHIALLTAIPFAICTIITFAGQLLKKLYNRIIDI
ncbi:MAG: hypothetical protein KF862_18640 [Chitinophagaceae bacterium]|nr:hypothetical protein [Chitinophagaceae bacterium]